MHAISVVTSFYPVSPPMGTMPNYISQLGGLFTGIKGSEYHLWRAENNYKAVCGVCKPGSHTAFVGLSPHHRTPLIKPLHAESTATQDRKGLHGNAAQHLRTERWGAIIL